MAHPTFTTPDLTTFCDLDHLGLVVVGQHRAPDRTTLECRVAETDPWCRRCGTEGVPRDTRVRRLAHVPFGHRPTTLLVRVRRYRCASCGRVWRQTRVRVLRELHEDDPEGGYRVLSDDITDLGYQLSERRVLRLCHVAGIRSTITTRKRRYRKAGPPVHDDLVNRQSTADKPNQLWLTDITDHWTAWIPAVVATR